MDLHDTIEQERRKFAEELSQAVNDAALQAVRNRYLSRDKGVMAAIMSEVAAAPSNLRPTYGRAANALKAEIETEIAAKRAALEAVRKPAGAVDVTLPGRILPLGHRHPL